MKNIDELKHELATKEAELDSANRRYDEAVIGTMNGSATEAEANEAWAALKAVWSEAKQAQDELMDAYERKLGCGLK